MKEHKIRWEYRIEYTLNMTCMLNTLNLLGKEGWEFIVMLQNGALVFKRPI